MTTNELPRSVKHDPQATGSQLRKMSYDDYSDSDDDSQTGHAIIYGSTSVRTDNAYHLTDGHRADPYKADSSAYVSNMSCGYKNQPDQTRSGADVVSETLTTQLPKKDHVNNNMNYLNGQSQPNSALYDIPVQADTNIPDRVFMNGLIKHTIIALAIIIPLAAFSAYAAPVSPLDKAASSVMKKNDSSNHKTTSINNSAHKTKSNLAVKPSTIIYKDASVPTTVDRVDLEQYAGTWYEIGRLPMFFQRNCARDVTANYTQKTDGSGITVLNKCTSEDGSAISAEGLAKPADETGSKLEVTFLPSWIRWLPVGRADYWVLARDPDYKTALVGTPDKEYLWLLARTPNINQEAYAKYRQIAQQQGYDLKAFNLTPQKNQTVNLVP